MTDHLQHPQQMYIFIIRRKKLPKNHGEEQLNYIKSDENYKKVLLKAGDAVKIQIVPTLLIPLVRGVKENIAWILRITIGIAALIQLFIRFGKNVD